MEKLKMRSKDIISGNVNKISAAASSKIEVKYAQNSVTDTLITLGSYMPDEDGKVEINLDQPIAVSHIFLYCDSQISDITISEYESVNLLNLYPKCLYYDNICILSDILVEK